MVVVVVVVVASVLVAAVDIRTLVGRFRDWSIHRSTLNSRAPGGSIFKINRSNTEQTVGFVV